MNMVAMGQVGLTGMRGRLARRAAPAIARRTPLEEERVLAIIGWAVKLVRSLIAAGRQS
jgi:hypothetical protein